MALETTIVPCLDDNFGYILRCTETGQVGLIDVPEVGPIKAELEKRGLGVDVIFVTHHHDAHIHGVDEIREAFGAKVIGHKNDANRLPSLDEAVVEGDTVALGNCNAEVWRVDGHTVGHIAFYFKDDATMFSADSLMALGCGRVFEGTMDQMWETLDKFRTLPPETEVYSGHDYLKGNAAFAMSVDGKNEELKRRVENIEASAAAGGYLMPASMALEMATNPFLRAPQLKEAIGMPDATDAEAFAEIRSRKDNF